MSGNTVIMHRSTDSGAPVLDGIAGSLVALFDACLVNGYNSHTLTSITRSGSTATANFTSHGYAADNLTKIKISGATQTEYNGTFTPFNVTANSFDFTVTGTPATPATGTIVAIVPPLGWTKPYSTTNIGVYRSSEVTGTQRYLRVNDNNPSADSYKTAWMRGYEAMTAHSTGTGLFPTVAQMTDGIYLNKSTTSDSDPRPWVLMGDGFEFVFFYENHVSYAGAFRQFHFGDPASEMATDTFGCLIYGDTTASESGTPETGQVTHQFVTSGGLATPQVAHYMARGYAQTGTAVNVGKFSDNVLANSDTFGRGSIAYPATTNNGLYIAPIIIGDPSNNIRCTLKCIYNPLHSAPLGNAATISNVTALSGHKLYSVSTAYSGATKGETLVDLTGPWR